MTEARVTIARIILAVLAASFVGSVLVVLSTAVAGAISDGTAVGTVPLQIFHMAIILLPLVFIASAAIALFIAAPCWTVLHLMGRRSWVEAAILGGSIACAVSLLPGPGHAPTLAGSGMVAAVTAWRVVYGAQRKTGGIAPARSFTSG
jgi:hypothetical protein